MDAQAPIPTRDPSFEEYLTCWVNWVIGSRTDLKRNTLSILVKGLRYETSLLSDKSPYDAFHSTITNRLTLICSIVNLMNKITVGQHDFETIANMLLRPFTQSAEIVRFQANKVASFLNRWHPSRHGTRMPWKL